VKVLKTKVFAKWAKKNKVSDTMLSDSVDEIIAGNYEANLGGGIIKKRVANKGRGKRGSARTIVALKRGTNCFFIYGFEKNAKSNISDAEEKALKIMAKSLFEYTDKELLNFIKQGKLIEVNHDKK
tara:strand:+ start:423 stop:800 length:378 start_codon:yes stop_codon:yes gene_type:complete